jgi:streptogramin lyase
VGDRRRLNAIVRVDDRTHRVRVYPLPADRPDTNLNTATFSGRTLVVHGAVRHLWSDSRGRLWISEYVAGRLGRYDPPTGRWRERKLPGDAPQPNAIYVDDRDIVWLSGFASNRLVRFDGRRFRTYPWPAEGAAVRQLLGRPGELWGAQSGADSLVVARTG